MKKIFNIAIFAALLLGAAACTELLDPNLRETTESQIPEDARVTVCFGAEPEIATKARNMASDPQIESMHVFVFSKVGVLIEAVPARSFTAVTTNGPAGAKVWVADLLMGAAERHLHLVANLPAGYTLPTHGSENEIMRGLITEAPAAAYWQRVVLAHGIKPYTYDGTGTYTYVNPTTGETVPVDVSTIGEVHGVSPNITYTYTDPQSEKPITVEPGDYINTNGKKVLDGKGLFAAAEVSQAVSLIPMVRNFARIEVRCNWSGHTLQAVRLANFPKAGYVVPFNESTNDFVAPYLNVGTTALVETAVEESNYSAPVPPAGIETEAVSAPASMSGGVATLFMYERGIPTSDPTCLLAQISGRWYKIEIAKTDGSYFPIYRDFTYQINIGTISGTNGYGSYTEALGNAAVGDLSSADETKTLEKIEDGKGLTLHVEYIDYTDLDNNVNQHTTTLLYKCYFTSNGNTTNLTNKVKFTTKKYQNTDTCVMSVVPGTSEYTGGGTPDGQGGWYQATITLDGVGSDIKKSDLHVEADLTVADIGYAKKIGRDVVYRVLPKKPITVTASNLASDAQNQTTTVSITVPANLGYSLFPMTLMIEASNNCLTPTETLTVETGKSLSGNNQNTYYFLKTISYSEYETNTSHVFNCQFKTTKTSGNTPATIYVKDKKDRFDLATCTLSSN